MVLFAGIAGIFLTCVLAIPMSVIYEILDDWSWRNPMERLPAILKGMLSGVLIFPIVFLLASPVIAVSMAIAVMLRKVIERFLILFSVVSAFGMAIAMRSIAEDSRIAGDREPFSITITGVDILACLIAAVFFLIAFYHMAAHYAVKDQSSTPPEPRHQDDQ
jgi:hypothetical protein